MWFPAKTGISDPLPPQGVRPSLVGVWSLLVHVKSVGMAHFPRNRILGQTSQPVGNTPFRGYVRFRQNQGFRTYITGLLPRCGRWCCWCVVPVGRLFSQPTTGWTPQPVAAVVQADMVAGVARQIVDCLNIHGFASQVVGLVALVVIRGQPG